MPESRRSARRLAHPFSCSLGAILSAAISRTLLPSLRPIFIKVTRDSSWVFSILRSRRCFSRQVSSRSSKGTLSFSSSSMTSRRSWRSYVSSRRRWRSGLLLRLLLCRRWRSGLRLLLLLRRRRSRLDGGLRLRRRVKEPAGAAPAAGENLPPPPPAKDLTTDAATGVGGRPDGGGPAGSCNLPISAWNRESNRPPPAGEERAWWCWRCAEGDGEGGGLYGGGGGGGE